MESCQEYETKKWLYLISLPLMWILTLWVMFKKLIFGSKLNTNTFWFDGLSDSCRAIKEGAASWRALDVIYNFQFGKQNNFASNYWVGMMNAQAVRNRLKLVQKELLNTIRRLAKTKKRIRILSIASGSAQSVIEAMAQAEKEDIDVSAIFLDLDPTAIEYSRKVARQKNIEERIRFVVGSTANLEKLVNNAKPHIIEMIGFLDYRPHKKAVHLVKRINNILALDGVFFTANVCSNSERHFLKWVINWPMIYRKPKELKKILSEGGFNNHRIIFEPLKIHAVAVCRKLVEAPRK